MDHAACVHALPARYTHRCAVASEPQQPQLYKALVMAQQRAARLVLLAEGSAVQTRLSGTLPVLIEHDCWEEAAEAVDDLVIGDAEVWRRAVPGSRNPNPRGGDAPYISEEGVSRGRV